MISSTPGFFQSSLSVHPAFGWAEDLAAKRRPRLWPDGSRAERTAPPRTGTHRG
ncbi:hypothetical protein [Streptomyces sp. NPDC005876]|uniref:hypothetical protein n=1 Tax=unclassified Streptomyces TaxID=2593676 RepID=UPI0033F1CD27